VGLPSPRAATKPKCMVEDVGGYANELTRFLGFVVLGATGLLGEIQLGLAAHSFIGPLGARALLDSSAILSGMLGLWGLVASSESFVRIGRAEFPPGVPTADPDLPIIPFQAYRLRRWMAIQSRAGGGPRPTVLDVGIILVFTLMVLVGAYAVV